MKTKTPRRFRITSFILPGFHHLTSGFIFKGLIFISLATTVGALAVYLNQYFFLPYYWSLKGMLLPHILVEEFYATKQSTAYNFINIYLIIGAAAFLDLALSLAPSPKNQLPVSAESNSKN